MAKQVKNNPAKKLPAKAVKKQPKVEQQTPFWGLERYLENNEAKAILILLGISLLFSFFLFDIRISEGGDDSGYIERGWNFIKHHEFPFYQGPLYPLVLSIPIYFAGINLFILKSLSVLFALGNIWFTYLAFRKRIPYLVLFSLLFFMATNNYIQYYASQTYTESFFLFLQALALYLVMKCVDSMTTTIDKTKINYKQFLLAGFIFALLTLAKSIAIVCFISVVLFFVLYKNYRHALYTLFSFVLFKAAIELLIRAFYPGGSGQLQQILLKDLYKPELGFETFGSMIDRFFSNFQYFASVGVLKLLHLRDPLTLQADTFLAIVVTLIIVLTAIFAYKNNKYVFFSGVYLIILCGGIFAGIQSNNKQERLMLITLPFIFIVLIHGLYRFASKSSVLRFYFLIFLAAYLILNLYSTIFGERRINTIDGAIKNFSILQKNMKGDKYYGYTDDWVNYLKMSEYCADSLPPGTLVAARKASMSFIYGNGKEFYPVFVVFSNDPDTVLATFKRDKVTHVMLASLRQNTRVNNGQVVNTLHRLLYPIAQKYPQKLTLVKQIGESEPAALYKINY